MNNCVFWDVTSCGVEPHDVTSQKTQFFIVTSQKTQFFIVTTVKASNLTFHLLTSIFMLVASLSVLKLYFFLH
jgi:hypothetical protein